MGDLGQRGPGFLVAVGAEMTAPSAALRPGGRCSRLPHSVGEAKTGDWRLGTGDLFG